MAIFFKNCVENRISPLSTNEQIFSQQPLFFHPDLFENSDRSLILRSRCGPDTMQAQGVESKIDNRLSGFGTVAFAPSIPAKSVAYIRVPIGEAFYSQAHRANQQEISFIDNGEFEGSTRCFALLLNRHLHKCTTVLLRIRSPMLEAKYLGVDTVDMNSRPISLNEISDEQVLCFER